MTRSRSNKAGIVPKPPVANVSTSIDVLPPMHLNLHDSIQSQMEDYIQSTLSKHGRRPAAPSEGKNNSSAKHCDNSSSKHCESPETCPGVQKSGSIHGQIPLKAIENNLSGSTLPRTFAMEFEFKNHGRFWISGHGPFVNCSSVDASFRFDLTTDLPPRMAETNLFPVSPRDVQGAFLLSDEGAIVFWAVDCLVIASIDLILKGGDVCMGNVIYTHRLILGGRIWPKTRNTIRVFFQDGTVEDLQFNFAKNKKVSLTSLFNLTVEFGKGEGKPASFYSDANGDLICSTEGAILEVPSGAPIHTLQMMRCRIQCIQRITRQFLVLLYADRSIALVDRTSQKPPFSLEGRFTSICLVNTSTLLAGDMDGFMYLFFVDTTRCHLTCRRKIRQNLKGAVTFIHQFSCYRTVVMIGSGLGSLQLLTWDEMYLVGKLKHVGPAGYDHDITAFSWPAKELIVLREGKLYQLNTAESVPGKRSVVERDLMDSSKWSHYFHTMFTCVHDSTPFILTVAYGNSVIHAMKTPPNDGQAISQFSSVTYQVGFEKLPRPVILKLILLPPDQILFQTKNSIIVLSSRDPSNFMLEHLTQLSLPPHLSDARITAATVLECPVRSLDCPCDDSSEPPVIYLIAGTDRGDILYCGLPPRNLPDNENESARPLSVHSASSLTNGSRVVSATSMRDRLSPVVYLLTADSLLLAIQPWDYLHEETQCSHYDHLYPQMPDERTDFQELVVTRKRYLSSHIGRGYQVMALLGRLFVAGFKQNTLFIYMPQYHRELLRQVMMSPRTTWHLLKDNKRRVITLHYLYNGKVRVREQDCPPTRELFPLAPSSPITAAVLLDPPSDSAVDTPFSRWPLFVAGCEDGSLYSNSFLGNRWFSYPLTRQPSAISSLTSTCHWPHGWTVAVSSSVPGLRPGSSSYCISLLSIRHYEEDIDYERCRHVVHTDHMDDSPSHVSVRHLLFFPNIRGKPGEILLAAFLSTGHINIFEAVSSRLEHLVPLGPVSSDISLNIVHRIGIIGSSPKWGAFVSYADSSFDAFLRLDDDGRLMTSVPGEITWEFDVSSKSDKLASHDRYNCVETALLSTPLSPQLFCVLAGKDDGQVDVYCFCEKRKHAVFLRTDRCHDAQVISLFISTVREAQHVFLLVASLDRSGLVVIRKMKLTRTSVTDNQRSTRIYTSVKRPRKLLVQAEKKRIIVVGHGVQMQEFR